MKKLWMGCVVFFFIMALVTVGAVDAQTTSKPLVIRVAEISPPTGPRAEMLQKAMADVERLTEGRIKMEVYWSETLVKTKEIPKAIQRGVADIGYCAPTYHPAEFPLMTHFMYVAFHPKGEDSDYITRKGWELYDNCKPLRDEVEKLGQTVWIMLPYDSYVMYSKKIVKGLDDMKGMRIRVTGDGYAKMVKAIGAFPTYTTAPELYNALERGTVDAALSGWEPGKRYGFFEVVPYVIETNFSFQYAFNNVSLSALQKMSEKDRKTFLEVGRRSSLEFGERMKKERAEIKAFMIAKGIKVLPFPDEERDKWAANPEVNGLIKEWIDDQNKAGRPGTEVMKTFLKVWGIEKWMPSGY
ncbi:MAG: TRAP transporter substrate-binding protein DctP [Pseudomonadota bacterium]